MPYTETKLWQKAPFLRLLLPFAIGIVLQWYMQLSLYLLVSAFVATVVLIIAYTLLSIRRKFSFTFVNGLLLNFLLFLIGGLTVWAKDVRHDPGWFGKSYANGDALLLTLEEPLVEKTASYKALASVQGVFKRNKFYPATGSIIIYFKKDDARRVLGYGSQIVVNKPLQEITNSGNPGSFDYKRYNLFNGITHQLYLTSADYINLPQKKASFYKKILHSSRAGIIAILQKHISGEKEQGLAEALLIGYKDDLDKKLVDAYSNTGVVHVIAISGLHLGIIYWLLLFITKPLKRRKAAWLRFVLIILGLWSFSLLAGAQPSVLRSAVMFSALALSTALHRQSSIYNTLALSAFALLCWNPFWLWDVGFQLSYLAVLSIVLFFKPVYDWLYFPNKSLDFIWKLMAVSLAAQILTLPVSVYHFHQFPFLFLFANLLAVPLSSIILIGEILLCIVAPLAPVASVTGTVLTLLIKWMNTYVERLDKVSFAVWDSLYLSPLQAALLYAIIAAGAVWLMEKERRAMGFMLGCVLLFVLIRSMSFIEAEEQKKLIVYNVPRHQAIDVISGRTYQFIGDGALSTNDFLRNFHIQPSRVMHRIKRGPTNNTQKSFRFFDKQILIADTTIALGSQAKKPVIDVLILSKNPKIYINQLVPFLTLKRVVSDGSVPPWKARLWKRDCDSLQIPFYDVRHNGAFVMNL